MKSTSSQDFHHLPQGTIFSCLDDGALLGLYRKGNTIYDENNTPLDFFFSHLTPAQRFTSSNPASEYFYVDPTEERWALFDDSITFLVYEQNDIQTLINLLNPTQESSTREK